MRRLYGLRSQPRLAVRTPFRAGVEVVDVDVSVPAEGAAARHPALRRYSGAPCRSGSHASSRGPFSSHTAKRWPRGGGAYIVTPAYSPFLLRM